MSDIAPVGPSGVLPSTLTGRTSTGDTTGTNAAGSTSSTRGSDQVDFSPAAQWLSKLSEIPSIRQDLVDRVKGQISQGTYVTPDKIDGAITNLAEDINH